ncbi:hypothetical protein BC351_05525 [Paenibacillus ferrarius]|uniref:Uncharacterized protein n=1 Tax=Paenibacillus ferrarius TaxID=1469647 RepID=A0A1V4HFI5_9BACL|nr:hypothetical protein BC351_05525 [Paenibacillus ferrarius]
MSLGPLLNPCVDSACQEVSDWIISSRAETAFWQALGTFAGTMPASPAETAPSTQKRSKPAKYPAGLPPYLL